MTSQSQLLHNMSIPMLTTFSPSFDMGYGQNVFGFEIPYAMDGQQQSRHVSPTSFKAGFSRLDASTCSNSKMSDSETSSRGSNSSEIAPRFKGSDPNKESYEKKYKTELCKNFQLRGYCKWGDKCCFAHGTHELKEKKHLNNKYKSKICKHYHKKGFCPYGYRCQYFHIKESYTEFLTTFAEQLELKLKENPSAPLKDIVSGMTHM